MPKIEPFEKHTDHYEDWFDRNQDLYEAELKAVRSLLPPFEKGLEIGVGTGRFAAPLHIRTGVEPSPKMAGKAEQRGIRVIEGTAEALPFTDAAFDLVMMVTTICFVDDISQSFREAHRVLEDGGYLLLGFIDKNSEMGRKYQNRRSRSRFYRNAVFVSTTDVLDFLQQTGFNPKKTCQAILPEKSLDIVKTGFGQGSFVAIRSMKSST